MEAQKIDITQLHPNNGQLQGRGLPKNPRFIRDNKYKALLQSIKDDPEMLDLRELIAYDSGDPALGLIVVGGNMRLRAMKELGYTEAPAKVLPPAFPMDKLRRIVLKDNSSFGETDFDALINEWELDEIAAAAIDIPDIADPKTDEAEDAEDDNFDITAATPKVAKAKLGDLYKLGNHRLICGDSTKPKFIAALMDGGQADLLVTDPPYNVDYNGKSEVLNAKMGGVSKINNDSMNEVQFLAFLVDAFKNADAVMRKGCAYYIWHSDSHGYTFRNAVAETETWLLKQVLVWNKNTMVLGRQDYQWKHEPCLYGWKEGAGHYFVDKRNLTTVFEDQPDIESMSKAEMKDLLEKIFVKKEIPTTVIDCQKPAKSLDHPTMKPVPLIGRLIHNSSRHGDVVLDIFGGSGTTLIAAEQLGRHARLVEYEPIYIDVIIKRWEELTGNKAVLLCNILEGEEIKD